MRDAGRRAQDAEQRQPLAVLRQLPAQPVVAVAAAEAVAVEVCR